ncbi:hypothetical protein JL722_14668 [Aureococcus anophagefferens]|nr:hypothetical protein JL722_14668 [Aureococcus anophagefferens]
MAPRRSFSKRFMPAPKNVAAFLVAVLAMLACVVSDIARRAPTPRRGKAIGVVDYKVDAAWLRDRGDAASAKLATTFVQSKPTRRRGARRAGGRATRVGRIALYAVDHYLFWALQRYLGWSRPDASGFLRKASLYAAEAQRVARRRRRDVRADAAPARRAGGGGGDPRWPFGAAALLNVLDRCDDPGGLLDAAAAAAPGGLLLVATVLPFKGVVHEGKRWSAWGKANTRSPRKPLEVADQVHVKGRMIDLESKAPAAKKFEAAAAAFVDALVDRRPDLELQAWTRLPYVSSGDSKKSHYTLDVALMAFRVGTAFEAVLAGGGAPAATSARAAAPASRSTTRRRRPARARAATRSSTGSRSARGGGGLFGTRAESWGDVLDAGAGLSSTCWLAHTPFATLTAVTARAAGTDAYGDRLRDAFAGAKVDVVVGNWREAGFLAGKRYDAVVADYLLGAVELHWPHGADAVLARLLGALKPGGTLLFVGVEPYESLLDRADDADRLVLDVESLGDSAAALAGEATYRELPEAWITRQVDARDGYAVVASETFPMTLSAASLRKQVTYARTTSAKIADAGLQKAYERRVAELTIEVDWRERGHRTACKKIRDDRAAEAARAEAPTPPPPPPREVFYGPAPRSHADEIRARIAAEHEAARLRREANPEPEPISARYGSRCPVCLEKWDVNERFVFQACCARLVCESCEERNGLTPNRARAAHAAGDS